jgi:hypothetical protein
MRLSYQWYPVTFQSGANQLTGSVPLSWLPLVKAVYQNVGIEEKSTAHSSRPG